MGRSCRLSRKQQLLLVPFNFRHIAFSRIVLHQVSLQVLWGECISGALYKGDFLAIAKAVGFADPRILSSSPIAIHDPEMKQLLGPTQFDSITARLFKLPGMLEPACEDYGQIAVYKVCLQGLSVNPQSSYIRSSLQLFCHLLVLYGKT